MAERHTFSMVRHIELFFRLFSDMSRLFRTLSTVIVFRVTLEQSPQKMQGRDSPRFALRGSTMDSHDAVMGGSSVGMGLFGFEIV